MGVPQFILLALLSFNVVLAAQQHGTLRYGRRNFYIVAADIVILAALLAWGGFWK